MQIPELKIRKLRRRSQRDIGKKPRYICNWADTSLQRQSQKANNEMGGAVIAVINLPINGGRTSPLPPRKQQSRLKNRQSLKSATV